MQFGRILGFPQKIVCSGERSDILLDSQSSSRLSHLIDPSWFHPSKLPEVRTELNASPYMYRSLQDDDIGRECHIRVPGNEIPKWFNHQSAKSSISLWVGPEFPTFALCVAFCLEDENAYGYVCVIDLFTNGHKQTLVEELFDNFRRDNRWFYGASHRLMQHIFGNFIQGDRNHVEISCKISSWTSETGGVIAPTIARLGVHVKCICGLQSSVINHETYYSELPMVMENGSDFSLGEPYLEIDSIAGDEFDLGLSSMARSPMNDVSDFNPYPPSKKIGNPLRERGQIYQGSIITLNCFLLCWIRLISFALLMPCRVDFCAMMILGASLQLNVGVGQRKNLAITNAHVLSSAQGPNNHAWIGVMIGLVQALNLIII